MQFIWFWVDVLWSAITDAGWPIPTLAFSALVVLFEVKYAADVGRSRQMRIWHAFKSLPKSIGAATAVAFVIVCIASMPFTIYNKWNDAESKAARSLDQAKSEATARDKSERIAANKQTALDAAQGIINNLQAVIANRRGNGPPPTMIGSGAVVHQTTGDFGANVLGNNNQVSINKPKPRRRLSPEQQLTLAKALSGFQPISVFVLRCPGDSELQDFADDLERFSRRIGWSIGGGQEIAPCREIGLVIRFKSELIRSPAIAVFIKELRGMGYQVAELAEYRLEREQMQIQVSPSE